MAPVLNVSIKEGKFNSTVLSSLKFGISIPSNVVPYPSISLSAFSKVVLLSSMPLSSNGLPCCVGSIVLDGVTV